MKDIHSRKVLINKSELKYSGALHENQILGKSDFDLYPARFAKISIEEDREVFLSRLPILDKETFSISKDGKESWFLTSKIPMVNDQNILTGLVGISYDITERKKQSLTMSGDQTLGNV